MKKKLLTILLSIFTFISAFSTRIFADEHNHNGWTNWGDKDLEWTSLPSEEGNYYLTHDVNISSTWNVSGTINLCLNGYVINVNYIENGSNFSAITIGNGATLNLYDCDTTAKHYFTKDETSGLWILAEDQTTPTDYYVTGGVITGGKGCMSVSEYLGGGVYVSSGGTFVMNGGTIAGCSATKGGGVFTWGKFTMNNNSAIIGCTATVDGGGVCACNCAFTMNDNSIVSDCVADNGAGGVYICGIDNNIASFTMNNNSKISYCIANGNHTTLSKKRFGGGVCVEGVNCNFTMSDGTIFNCSSNKGGAINVFSGNFNMNNGTISSCTSTDGGGVFVNENATFTMSDGTIFNCSSNKGGAINVFSGNFNMNNGTISSCTSTDGGGVFVNENATFTMSNGTINNNEARNCGGGVNNQGTFNMEDGVIEFNGAIPVTTDEYFGGGGVAIYYNGKGTLTGGKIQNNSSTVKGGGVLFLEAYNTTGNVSFSGVSIVNNTAVTAGGGVFVDNSPVKIHLGGNTIIKDNKLSDGNVSNLHLGREETNKTSNLNIDSSSQKAMDIGLSNGSIKIKNATSGDETYFFADDEEHDAYYNSDDDGGFIELSYKITDGAHSTINILKDEDASFTSTADFSKFSKVEVDGVIVDSSNYTASPGSTQVTLKASYLDTLSIGSHTLKIVSIGGYASTTFTITKNSPSPSPDPTPRYKIPNTGVDGTYSNNHSLLKLSSLSLLTIGTHMVIKKKKDN